MFVLILDRRADTPTSPLTVAVRIRTVQPALDLKQELRKIPLLFPGRFRSRRAAIRVQKQRTGISPGKKTFAVYGGGKQIAHAEQGRKTDENREQMVGQSRPGLMPHGGKSLGLLNRRVEGRMKRNWRLSLKPCVELIYPAWRGKRRRPHRYNYNFTSSAPPPSAVKLHHA